MREGAINAFPPIRRRIMPTVRESQACDETHAANQDDCTSRPAAGYNTYVKNQIHKAEGASNVHVNRTTLLRTSPQVRRDARIGPLPLPERRYARRAPPEPVPALLHLRRGRGQVRRGRQPHPGLLPGAWCAYSRSFAPGGRQGGPGADGQGHSLLRFDGTGDGVGKLGQGANSERGEGALPQFGHRGRHDGYTHGACLHG